MASKEVTRDEILALQCAAQIVVEKATKLLAKMDRKPQKQTVDMQKMLADWEAKRKKTFQKVKDSSVK